MSITDELRAELTTLGVEWKAPSSYDGSNRYDTVAGGYWFHEFDGKITIHGLTPAQAIAATLGSGTCHMEQDFRRWDDDLGWLTSYTCSVCGESVILMSDRKPSCCPNCGRRVVEVDE